MPSLVFSFNDRVVSSRLIKDIPDDERPREKLKLHGARSLTDSEILAIFFSTGREGASSIDLGRELIDQFGSLKNLAQAEHTDLEKIKGIGPAKSSQLLAVFEFGRRLARATYKAMPISSPNDVFDLMGPEMQGLTQESVRVVLLNHRKELIRSAEIFLGTKSECFANPPEILKPAITHSASSMILVHNHPSGDPSPSSADIQVTRKMNNACETVGIPLDDHIIIGCVTETYPEGYYSFRESGLL